MSEAMSAEESPGAVELARLDALGALTAIRVSAELLRDCPDIGADQRNRFIAIVLEEEARLERLLRELGDRLRGV